MAGAAVSDNLPQARFHPRAKCPRAFSIFNSDRLLVNAGEHLFRPFGGAARVNNGDAVGAKPGGDGGAGALAGGLEIEVAHEGGGVKDGDGQAGVLGGGVKGGQSGAVFPEEFAPANRGQAGGQAVHAVTHVGPAAVGPGTLRVK